MSNAKTQSQYMPFTSYWKKFKEFFYIYLFIYIFSILNFDVKNSVIKLILVRKPSQMGNSIYISYVVLLEIYSGISFAKDFIQMKSWVISTIFGKEGLMISSLNIHAL